MCGIFGYYLKDKYNELFKNDEEIFSRFIKLISHRGPDDNSNFLDNNFYGIFYRLSIQDLSLNGRQPMLSKCKNLLY